ncbi:hypothetical protein D1B31_01675 [Neobacillus notoginsengisoli]|uniref:Uncharacterized protein n=1 Tax=Neobacillus notoginsengisoli TaxID=1578198 RepID=A0A417YZU4_9BACI|nr:hypothetical protein [Neobacillus notoginsengisoli]RHW43397.1 hypothetical protein D1B31_01675 [Neobacillus notoginsengisoli]
MVKRIVLVLLFLMNLLVLLSPFATKSPANNNEDLKNTVFGLPFPFLIQDQSSYVPPFPYEMSMSSPWENPTTIKPVSLIISLFVVNVPIYLLYYLIGLRRK